MQLDEEDLKWLCDIANRRELLSRRGSVALGAGRSMRDIMNRRVQLRQEEEALIARFLNKGLRAAGLENAIDPETLPLPAAHPQPGPFCAPDPLLMAECAARKPIVAQVKALDIPEIHK